MFKSNCNIYNNNLMNHGELNGFNVYTNINYTTLHSMLTIYKSTFNPHINIKVVLISCVCSYISALAYVNIQRRDCLEA